jgi:hypothetical protein
VSLQPYVRSIDQSFFLPLARNHIAHWFENRFSCFP